MSAHFNIKEWLKKLVVPYFPYFHGIKLYQCNGSLCVILFMKKHMNFLTNKYLIYFMIVTIIWQYLFDCIILNKFFLISVMA